MQKGVRFVKDFGLAPAIIELDFLNIVKSH